jgi:hypothetical protein
VRRNTIFQIMMNAIDAPGRFSSVSSVFVRPAEGEAGDDGALWRSMRYDGDGPLHGTTVVEHIYANPGRGEIKFVAVDEGGESEHEVVHKLLTKPLRIEYFRRHRDTLERVQWDEPRASASRAIEITIAMAKAKEQQLCDPDFVAAKA